MENIKKASDILDNKILSNKMKCIDFSDKTVK